MSNSDRLAGPDFLDSVADQSAAQGLPVNAAEFRQRATDWRADQARIEQLEADLARLERQLRSDTERARILDKLKTHLQAADEALAWPPPPTPPTRLAAETSNARGDVVAWFPTYASGEIVRNYGDGSPVYACKTKEEAEQAKRCHLGATGPVIPLYAAPPPAAAEPKTLPVPTRVYLTDKAAVIVGTPERGWDEDAQDAHNCDAMGCATIGPHVLARVPFTDERAMSQPAEAQGVVDEPLSHADLCRLSRVFNAHNVPGLDQDRRINEWLGKRIAESLTGERNE